MELKCTQCKFIFCNFDFDDLLDCELSKECSGIQKCYMRNFDQFQKEENESIVKQYVDIFNEQNIKINVF